MIHGRISAFVFLILLLAAPAIAQDNQVSHYMREMGLTYLEQVDAHHYNPNDQFYEIKERSYERLMDGIEARIKLNISTEADKQYLELLTIARVTRSSQQIAISQDAEYRVYQRECFKDNGKPKRTVLSICQMAPRPASEQTKSVGAWFPQCFVEAKSVYEGGVISDLGCTKKAVFSAPPQV